MKPELQNAIDDSRVTSQHHSLVSLVHAAEQRYGVRARPIPNNSRIHGTVVDVGVCHDNVELAVIANDQAIYVVSLSHGHGAQVGQVMALDKTGDHVRMTPVRAAARPGGVTR